MTKINIDWFANTLTNLCCKYTPFNSEWKLHKYIIPILKEAGFTVFTGKEYVEYIGKEIQSNFDNYNALYAIRGDNPSILLNAHMDIVPNKIGKYPYSSMEYPAIEYITSIDKDGLIKLNKLPKNIASKLDDIFNFFLEHSETLEKEEEIDQEILRHGNIMYAQDSLIGGDDKCGVAIVLALAVSTNIPLKINLTSGEEIGKGSKLTDPSFYDGVSFSFTPDRRDNNHFIQSIGGYKLCSDEFRNFMMQIGLKHKGEVKLEPGMGADPTSIAPYVSECFNCSAGYYNPHTDKEYIKLDEVMTTYSWLNEAMLSIHNSEFLPVRKPVEQYIQKYSNRSSMFSRRQSFFPDNSKSYNTQYLDSQLKEITNNILNKVVKISSLTKFYIDNNGELIEKNTIADKNINLIGLCVGFILDKNKNRYLLKIKPIKDHLNYIHESDDDTVIFVDRLRILAIGNIVSELSNINFLGKRIRIANGSYDMVSGSTTVGKIYGNIIMMLVSPFTSVEYLGVLQDGTSNVIITSKQNIDTLTIDSYPIIHKSHKEVKRQSVGYVSLSSYEDDSLFALATFPFLSGQNGLFKNLIEVSKADYRMLSVEEKLELFKDN